MRYFWKRNSFLPVQLYLDEANVPQPKKSDISMFFFKENYEEHWHGVDFLNKKLLDIGADIGSTARHFLSKGVSQVIAVEGSPKYYKELERYAGQETRVTSIPLWVGKPEDFANLILTFKPDIAKIDCEHCERNLSQVSDVILRLVPTYLIEAHTYILESSIIKRLQSLGYKVQTYRYMRFNIIVAQLQRWRWIE